MNFTRALNGGSAVGLVVKDLSWFQCVLDPRETVPAVERPLLVS